MADLHEALDWLGSLKGAEWVSVEKGGRRWPVGELAEILLAEFARPASFDPESASEAMGSHPDFLVTCLKCGSTDVTVSNTMGWSGQSGGWGSVDLDCRDCHHSTSIAEAN